MTIINLSSRLKQAQEFWINSAYKNEEIKVYEPTDDSNLVLVRFPSNTVPEVFFAYWTNLSDIVCKGGFGVLYKTYRLDKQARVDLDQVDFVAKVPRPELIDEINPEEIRQEAAFLNNKSINTTSTFQTSSGYVFITKLIKGLDLFDRYNQLYPIFDAMTLTQRLELLTSITISLNLIHHDTLSTGSAIFHKDIKGNNIRIAFRLRKSGVKDQFIAFDKFGKVIPNKACFTMMNDKIIPNKGFQLILDAYPLDFGLSEKVPGPEKQNLKFGGGTADYVPVEISQGRSGGLKSDVFSLTPIFITLLKGKNVFSQRNNVFQHQLFKLDGICEDFPDFRLGNLSIRDDLIDSIKAFINLMQHEDYNKRPDMDVVLRFIQRLTSFKKEYEHLETLRTSQQIAEIKLQECVLQAYLIELAKLSQRHSLQEAANMADIYLQEVTSVLYNPVTLSQIIESVLSPAEKAASIIATIKPKDDVELMKISTLAKHQVLVVNAHLPSILDTIIHQLKQSIAKESDAGGLRWLFGFKHSDFSKQRVALANRLIQELTTIRKTLVKQGFYFPLEQLYCAEQQTMHLLTTAVAANSAIYTLFSRKIDNAEPSNALLETAIQEISNNKPTHPVPKI